MKYFRYGCLSISKNIAFTVIMVLEIAALLVTTNITIGSVNSKQVLARPFEDFLCKEGYYFNFDGSLDTKIIINSIICFQSSSLRIYIQQSE